MKYIALFVYDKCCLFFMFNWNILMLLQILKSELLLFYLHLNVLGAKENSSYMQFIQFLILGEGSSISIIG